MTARNVMCRLEETPVLRLAAACAGTGLRLGTSFELGDMTAAIVTKLQTYGGDKCDVQGFRYPLWMSRGVQAQVQKVVMHQVGLFTSRMTSPRFQPGPFESQDACIRNLRTKARSSSNAQARGLGTAVLQDTLSILFVVLYQVSLAHGDAPATA